MMPTLMSVVQFWRLELLRVPQTLTSGDDSNHDDGEHGFAKGGERNDFREMLA